MPAAFVFDTSAILAVLNAEEGAGEVMNILEEARKGGVVIHLPFMALMELEYLLLRSLPQGEVEKIMAMVEGWGVTVWESSPPWRREAARVKATTPLSLADAWIAALALLCEAKLVHKDPEYDHIPHLSGLNLSRKDG